MLIPLQQLINENDLKISGVIHLGAHLAEEKDAYDNAGIEQVFWVEGDSDVQKMLAKKLRGHKGHSSVCAILSEIDGKDITFYKTNDTRSSSILKLGLHRRCNPWVNLIDTEVRSTITVDTLIRKRKLTGFNFMYLSLRGAELLALKGAMKTLSEIDYIYTSVNVKETYQHCVLIPDLDAFLESQGFKREVTTMTRGYWGEALYVRKA